MSKISREGALAAVSSVRHPKLWPADFGAIITKVVAAMVEEVASQMAHPGDELAAQASLYERLAKACREKARLAKAMDKGQA